VVNCEGMNRGKKTEASHNRFVEVIKWIPRRKKQTLLHFLEGNLENGDQISEGEGGKRKKCRNLVSVPQLGRRTVVSSITLR